MAGFSSWGAAGTNCWLLAGGCNLRPSGIGWYLNASRRRFNRQPSRPNRSEQIRKVNSSAGHLSSLFPYSILLTPLHSFATINYPE